MKIIALGDTHGRKNWEEIVKQPADFYVFIGDYFDTHESTTPEEQIENFKKILEFKRENWDKVVLLIGNHDFHYLPYAMEQYSGFNPGYSKEIGALVQSAIEEDALQMCFTAKNYVFTHAGLTKTWLEQNKIAIDSNLDETINMLFLNNPSRFRYSKADASGYGASILQGPLWVRPGSLINDLPPGLIQVVGHTTQEHLVTLKRAVDVVEEVQLIDCLGTSGQHLELNV